MMDLLLEDVIEDDFPDPLEPPPVNPNVYPFSSPTFASFTKTTTTSKKSTGASTQQNGELEFMLSPPIVQTKT